MSSPSQHNNPEWIDIVAHKAQQAGQPIDEQLWQRIEQKLPATRRHRPWLWWGAAAATTAAIIALAITTRPARIDDTSSEVIAQATQPTTAPSILQEAYTQSPHHTLTTHTRSPHPSQKKVNVGVATATPADGTHATTPVAPIHEREQNRDTLTATNTTLSPQQSIVQSAIQHPQSANNDSQYAIHHSQLAQHDSHFNISFYGSGNLLAQNGTQAVQRPILMAMGNGRFIEAQAVTHYHYNHHIPLNVGIMVSKSLPHNLTAGIGMNYARYSSEVSADLERFDQTVQFIGIPVALQWRFWNYRRLSAYVGAEAMAERCVAVDRGDEQVDVPKRIQWSVHGMAGLQLSITQHLGLFVEPKVSHYATEFTLPTARNEHPLTFNLKMGVNISF